MAKKFKKIEVVDENTIPAALKTICICCDKKLTVDRHGTANAQQYPCVSDGVVFRSSGQYGSTVLDCGVGIPEGWEYEVQIIVCDECMIKKASIINAMKNSRCVYNGRKVVEFAEYDTFENLRKAQ